MDVTFRNAMLASKRGSLASQNAFLAREDSILACQYDSLDSMGSTAEHHVFFKHLDFVIVKYLIRSIVSKHVEHMTALREGCSLENRF